MQRVAFRGGPCDGLTAEVDRRDVISVLRVAVIISRGYRAVPDLNPDETIVEPIEAKRVVVLTAAISRDDLSAAHERWLDYYRWPTLDGDDAVQYRHERPPTLAAGFSASG